MKLKASHYLTLLELLRSYQRKNRFVGSGANLPVTPAATHFLVEIGSRREVFAIDLSVALRLDKSTISRELSNLRKKGIIQTEQLDEDRRRQSIRLTTKGQQLLKELDQLAWQRLQYFLGNMTNDEAAELRQFLKRLADGDDAPQIVVRPHDPPLRVEIARLTRSLGLIGESCLSSGYSSAQWQLLSELADDLKEVTAIDLSERLFLLPNTISIMVNRLESEGLLRREIRASDRRSMRLRLTASGQEMLRTIRGLGEKRFKNALGKISAAELERFTFLFAKCVGEKLDENGNVKGINVVVERLDSEQSRSLARSFFIENFFRITQHLQVPETLFAAKNLSFSIQIDKKTAAVCEFERKSGCHVIANLATSPQFDDSNEFLSALRGVCLKVLLEEKTPKILVPDGSLAVVWAKRLNGELRDKFWVIDKNHLQA